MRYCFDIQQEIEITVGHHTSEVSLLCICFTALKLVQRLLSQSTVHSSTGDMTRPIIAKA